MNSSGRMAHTPAKHLTKYQRLADNFGLTDDFRLMYDKTCKTVKKNEKQLSDTQITNLDQIKNKENQRMAIERLSEKVEFGFSYMTLMIMGGILAAVALLTSSVPILIGSMIVAPSLPPLGLVSAALASKR